MEKIKLNYKDCYKEILKIADYNQRQVYKVQEIN